MNAKTIIDVEINEERFDAFKAKFDGFKSDVEKLPGAWGKSETAADSLAEGFQSMTASIMAQTALMHEQGKEMDRLEKKETEAEKKRTDAQRREAKFMADTRRSSAKVVEDTKTIAGNVAKTTLNLLKWVTLGGAFTGLLGVGSLWGLGTLASRVGNDRRTAQGLGVSTGDRQAFGINFGRYVDSDNVLGKVAAAKSDMSQWGAFAAMGVNPAGKDPAELAIEMQRRAKSVFDAGGGTEQEAGAHGLLNFFTMEDLRRLHATSSKDLDKSETDYGRDRAAFGLSDDTSRKWQEFSMQMSRAGRQIQNVFVDALGDKVVPELTELSVQVAKTVAAFLKGDDFKVWMDKAAEGVKNFAQWLGKQDTQDKLKKFVDGVSLVGEEILAVAEKLKWLIPDKVQTERRNNLVERGGVAGRWLDDHHLWNPLAHPGATPRGGGASAAWRVPGSAFTAPAGAFTAAGGAGGQDAISTAARRWGVSEELMRRIYATESNSGRNPGLSRAGALGPMQFMPDTARQYGVGDRTDLKQSAEGAAHYMADLMKMFQGDLQKAAAAYNWGQGNVQKASARFGADWLSHAPQETQDYVRKTATPIQVTVYNNTGGSAAVSVNQVAQ